MKRIFTTLLFVFSVIMLHGQNLIVKSFELAADDLTASTAETSVMDQNGQKCALIKIKTDQKGFSFDVGVLSVLKTEVHEGETWVYTQEGVKKLTIMHNEFGVLREYDLGMMLRRGKTYHMLLDAKIKNNLSDLVNRSVIAVYPSDLWMNDNGYVEAVNKDGDVHYSFDYDTALNQNRDMQVAVRTVQNILSSRGFRVDKLEELKRNHENYDGTDQNHIYNDIINTSEFDIRTKLDYAVTRRGSLKDISFSLNAVHAGTNNRIAFCKGKVEGTEDPIDIVLKRLIKTHSDDFCKQLAAYFLDMQTNGKKIVVIFRAASAFGVDLLNDEIGDTEESYRDFLFKWIRQHSLNRTGIKGRQTRNTCEFKDIRIPLFNEDGSSIDPMEFFYDLRKDFSSQVGQSIFPTKSSTDRIVFIVGLDD